MGPDPTRRKLVEFDAETWHALQLLSRDSMKSLQELAEEAFGDLLKKHGRPVTLEAGAARERAPAARQRPAAAAQGLTTMVGGAGGRRAGGGPSLVSAPGRTGESLGAWGEP